MRRRTPKVLMEKVRVRESLLKVSSESWSGSATPVLRVSFSDHPSRHLQHIEGPVAVLDSEPVDGLLGCYVQLGCRAVQALELLPVVHIHGVNIVSLLSFVNPNSLTTT